MIPSITRNTLPTSILTNASAKGVVTVTLTNSSTAPISGPQTINVFALQYQGGQSFSSHDIGTVVKNVTLAPGASRSFTVNVNAISADGTPGAVHSFRP